MRTMFSRFVKEEDGATAIEYGLLAALISVVIIGAVSALGTSVSSQFNKIASTVGNASTVAGTPGGSSGG